MLFCFRCIAGILLAASWTFQNAPVDAKPINHTDVRIEDSAEEPGLNREKRFLFPTQQGLGGNLVQVPAPIIQNLLFERQALQSQLAQSQFQIQQLVTQVQQLSQQFFIQQQQCQQQIFQLQAALAQQQQLGGGVFPGGIFPGGGIPQQNSGGLLGGLLNGVGNLLGGGTPTIPGGIPGVPGAPSNGGLLGGLLGGVLGGNQPGGGGGLVGGLLNTLGLG